MRKTRGMIAAMLLAGAAAEGQGQARAKEMHLDSLARIAARTRAAVRAFDDSVRRNVRAIDTVYAASPIVVAEPTVSTQVRAIAPLIVDSVASVVGPAMNRIARFSYRVDVERRVDWRRSDTSRELVVSVVMPGGAHTRAWRAPVDSASLAASLHHALTWSAFTAVDPDLVAWAGNAIPDDTLRATEWANQRLLLISSASAVSGRCFRGDKDACRIALLLSPDSDPILEWHDSTTRRRLVRRHAAVARRMDARAEKQCLAGADAACITLLQLFPPGSFREPAATALRFGFLRHALAVGGSGAVERLLAVSAQNTSVRLEAAAGVPLDSLIGSWQTRVRETRAPSEDLTIGITIMSLAWATGMGALSLRSSRWR